MDRQKRWPEEEPKEPESRQPGGESPGATAIFNIDQFGAPRAEAEPTGPAGSVEGVVPRTPGPATGAGQQPTPPSPQGEATAFFRPHQPDLGKEAGPETSVSKVSPTAAPPYTSPFEQQVPPAPSGPTTIFSVDLFGPAPEPPSQTTPISQAASVPPASLAPVGLDQFGPVPTVGAPLGAPRIEQPTYVPPPVVPPAVQPTVTPTRPITAEKPLVWILLGAGAVVALALIVATAWIYLGRLREAAETPKLSPAGGVGRITGRVADQAGEPIASVKVIVRNQITGRVQEAVTDWSGKYLVSNLDPGQYELAAEAPAGFESRKISGVTVAENQELTSDLQVVLTNPATLAGRAVDSQGRPLRTFLVRAVDRSSQREFTGVGSGRQFQITGLAPGSYDVNLEPPAGYQAEGVMAVELRPGEVTRVELRAARVLVAPPVATGSIGGRVADDRGNPLGGVQVRVAEASGRAARIVATNASGQFRTTDLPVGTYRLEVDAALGFAPASVTGVKVSAGQHQQVNLALSRVAPAASPPATRPLTGSISGTVADSRGRPLRGVSVKLFSSPDGETLRGATTDAKGSFTMNDLDPGTYDVSVEPPSPYLSKRVTGLKVTAGQHLTASVSIPEPGARFRVTHDHKLGACAGLLMIEGGRVKYAADKGDHSFDYAASQLADVRATARGSFSIRFDGGRKFDFKSDQASEALEALERAKGAP